MKNIKSKSFYSEIENSIKDINKNNVSNSVNINNQSSRILKSIEKKLDNSKFSLKRSSSPIKKIQNTFRKKIKNQQTNQQSNQNQETNQQSTENQETFQNVSEKFYDKKNNQQNETLKKTQVKQTTQNSSQKQTTQNSSQKQTTENSSQEQTTENSSQKQVSKNNLNIYKSVFNNLKDSAKLIKTDDEDEKITTQMLKLKRPKKIKIINQKNNTNQNGKKKIVRPPTKANLDAKTITSLLKKYKNQSKPIQVSQTIFKGKNKEGDFEWEIKNKIEPRTIYLYLDKNEKTSDRDKNIMKYNKTGLYPRSMSIMIKETDTLSIPVKNKINQQMKYITNIIREQNYKKIKYNFRNVNDDIKNYLQHKIKNL